MPARCPRTIGLSKRMTEHEDTAMLILYALGVRGAAPVPAVVEQSSGGESRAWIEASKTTSALIKHCSDCPLRD
ncbi:MAG: hypothetical protein LBR82_07080 [Desulfovibrio sp.]|jgi:hypothetical protein|nr:hypothetical protein [Desulfovibrio sp.]